MEAGGPVPERLRGRLMSNVPESRPSLTVVLDGYRRAGVKRRLMGADEGVQEQKQVHLDTRWFVHHMPLAICGIAHYHCQDTQ